MEKLLIIADDFTGALDTGVHFAKCQVDSELIPFVHNCNISDKAAQVLIVNVNSRHLNAREAYEIVYKTVKEGIEAGYTYFYKKTDSALRGNIGSELKALLDATSANNLKFFPAFPKIGRTTIDGIQYCKGIPVAQTEFGFDKYEPVRHSDIKKIIREQTTIDVFNNGDIKDDFESLRGIIVFDSNSDEDMNKLGEEIGKQQLNVCAGCAGFAPILGRLLGFEEKPMSIDLSGFNQFMFICGTTNPITVRQIVNANSDGVRRKSLSPCQKRATQLPEAETKEIVDFCLDAMSMQRACILDVGDMAIEAEEGTKSKDAMRNNIVSVLGNISKSIFKKLDDVVYMCSGGDTLLAVIDCLGVKHIEIVGEIETGIVLIRCSYEGKVLNIISKSGGFGDAALVSRLVKRIVYKGEISC